MPAPVVRSLSARSCTRTVQPRCANAHAAVRPANPAPTISAWRLAMVSPALLAYYNRERWAVPARAEDIMARLRHFAVCVSDLDKAAEFYQNVFDLKRIAREDLDISSSGCICAGGRDVD